ncbi:MAG: cell division protein FtsZ [Thermoplasmatota archaeon]
MYVSRYSNDDNHTSDIEVLVVGVGGGGNNSINRLSRIGVFGAETIAVNTDREHLQNIQADTKMLIGKNINRGLGTGGNPAIGAECAEAAYGGLKSLFKNTDLVFITAGMGGGTGTGAAPIIAEVARRNGAMVITIVTMPFTVERNRKKVAYNGIKRIKDYSNSTIILDNDKLIEVVPDLPVDQAFGVLDALISDLIKNITEIITLPSLINLDFNDIKSVLGNGGVSTLMTGESNIQEPEKAVKEATENPFLNADYSGAKKALIHLTGGPDLSISKMNKVVEMMTSQLDPNANVIFGARVDAECKNKIRLMSIVTGLKKKKEKKRGLSSLI